ncbi:MAG: translation initiation factor IF-3 [Chloroflexi bacterium]|nr:translation initiation factor IF-3 [Chloroflexota bacterium]
MIKELRINERIRAKEVRLVGDKGEQLGIMPTSQAQEMARRANLDLVEVASTAVPPVCRLLDYGKYRYEQEKKERELRKSQKVTLVREIRIRPKIGDHDFDAKVRASKKLLEEGDKVRVVIMFRGREITHPDLGMKLLQRVVESLQGVAAIEKQPMLDGKRMIMVLSGAAKAKTTAKETATKTPEKVPAMPAAPAEKGKETQHAKAKNP